MKKKLISEIPLLNTQISPNPDFSQTDPQSPIEFMRKLKSKFGVPPNEISPTPLDPKSPFQTRKTSHNESSKGRFLVKKRRQVSTSEF